MARWPESSRPPTLEASTVLSSFPAQRGGPKGSAGSIIRASTTTSRRRRAPQKRLLHPWTVISRTRPPHVPGRIAGLEDVPLDRGASATDGGRVHALVHQGQREGAVADASARPGRLTQHALGALTPVVPVADGRDGHVRGVQAVQRTVDRLCHPFSSGVVWQAARRGTSVRATWIRSEMAIPRCYRAGAGRIQPAAPIRVRAPGS